MEPVLHCSGLVKRFGDRTAVDGVTFSIGVGETYGLLGPNGAGKTTTISMVVRPAHARRRRGPRWPAPRWRATPSRPRPRSASCPRTSRSTRTSPPARTCASSAASRACTGKALAARVDEVLEVVGLADRADERIETYSGGMKRRANIAVGLLHRPQLLVLDEPTVGVDPQSRNAILESIEALSGEGLSVLYTTHYMEEAERLCDRIGIIDAGRLVAEGTRRELIDQVGEGDRIEVTRRRRPRRLRRRVPLAPRRVRGGPARPRDLRASTNGAAALAAVVAAAGATGVAHHRGRRGRARPRGRVPQPHRQGPARLAPWPHPPRCRR